MLVVWGTNVYAAQPDPTPAEAAAIRQRLDQADQRFQLNSLLGVAVVLLLACLH